MKKRSRANQGAAIFIRQVNNGLELWGGDPDCQAAHDALLGVLVRAGPFITASETLTTRRQGNLGEFIALAVARHAPLDYTSVHAHNAFQPLQDISHAGLDVTYLYFDKMDANKDGIYIKAVKRCATV